MKEKVRGHVRDLRKVVLRHWKFRVGDLSERAGSYIGLLEALGESTAAACYKQVVKDCGELKKKDPPVQADIDRLVAAHTSFDQAGTKLSTAEESVRSLLEALVNDEEITLDQLEPAAWEFLKENLSTKGKKALVIKPV